MSIRIFIEAKELRAGPLTLKGEEHHYLSKVRRLRVDDELTLFDGAGQHATAIVLSIGKDQSELQVEEPTRVPKKSFALTIAPALIKGERMDLAVTKMVELGVDCIRPIVSERTIVRLKGDRAQARLKRFQSLALAAARQSRNPHPARIEPISDFASLLRDQEKGPLLLVPCLHASAIPLEEALPAAQPPAALVLIGPEGGFSDEEVSQAVKAGFIPVNLGPRTLRAETACIALATILSFRYGDVGRR